MVRDQRQRRGDHREPGAAPQDSWNRQNISAESAILPTSTRSVIGFMARAIDRAFRAWLMRPLNSLGRCPSLT
jgi:hypothetical protein